MLNISNQSLSSSLKPFQLISWIHENFTTPHSIKTKSLADLKSGVVIAQILTEILPQNYHSVLLSKIEVNNLTAEVCINNLKTIKAVVQNYSSMQGISDKILINHYTSQGLYYREQEMSKFMNNVIFKLWEFSRNKVMRDRQYKLDNNTNSSKDITTYPSTIAGHLAPQFSVEYNRSKSIESGDRLYQNKDRKSSKKENNYKNSSMNVSQLSDIINYSSIEVANVDNSDENQIYSKQRNNQRNIRQRQNESQYIQDQEQPNQERDYQQICHFNQRPPISQQQIQLLEQWIASKIGTCPTSQPHRLLGQLVNSIFSSSRLNNMVIKQAHFEHGPIFVYRKALQFLLTDTMAERLQKNNILMMMKGIQEEGVLRQGEFWRVIKDIYLFDMNKGKYMGQRSRNSSHNLSKSKQNHKLSTNKEDQKQNICINQKNSTKTLSKCKTSKQSLVTNPHLISTKSPTLPKLAYNTINVKESQQWISKILGYQHSLTKSKNPLTSFTQNPLLNGTLVASILMRLKIGKPIISKLPQSVSHMKNNWDQINKVCSLRGYEWLKKLLEHIYNGDKYDRQELVNFCLAILKQFRQEHNKKYPEAKNREKNDYASVESNKNCNECQWDIKMKPNLVQTNLKAQKEQIKEWLMKNYSFQISNDILNTSQLTQICRNLLNINIYRETTSKIQINNVQKILGELRRVGLGDYYNVTKENVMGINDQIRWKILWDLKWIIDGKIEFCHA